VAEAVENLWKAGFAGEMKGLALEKCGKLLLMMGAFAGSRAQLEVNCSTWNNLARQVHATRNQPFGTAFSRNQQLATSNQQLKMFHVEHCCHPFFCIVIPQQSEESAFLTGQQSPNCSTWNIFQAREARKR